jgi:hypothetical protein
MTPVRVGLVGSQFISAIHAEALKQVPRAELFAVASPTAGHAAEFAQRHGVRYAFRDYQELLEADEIDLVVLGCPNDLHCEFTERAAAAGKHVVCEKPLCLRLAEADRMIAACREAGVKLMYAEELCFAPKYVRLVPGGRTGNAWRRRQSSTDRAARPDPAKATTPQPTGGERKGKRPPPLRFRFDGRGPLPDNTGILAPVWSRGNRLAPPWCTPVPPWGIPIRRTDRCCSRMRPRGNARTAAPRLAFPDSALAWQRLKSAYHPGTLSGVRCWAGLPSRRTGPARHP